VTLTADEVRGIREGLGFTQAQLARSFGVNVRTVHRWESGGPAPAGTARAILVACRHLLATGRPEAVEELRRLLGLGIGATSAILLGRGVSSP